MGGAATLETEIWNIQVEFLSCSYKYVFFGSPNPELEDLYVASGAKQTSDRPNHPEFH